MSKDVKENPNVFDKKAPVTIIRVENGYKVCQSMDKYGYNQTENGFAIPNGEYVFNELKDAFEFIDKHFK